TPAAVTSYLFVSTSCQNVKALQKLKSALGLPLRFGWNGDPCVPQQHPWSGVDCQFDSVKVKWFIDGLGLDNQGLRGSLPDDISKLSHLQIMQVLEGDLGLTSACSRGVAV
nr:receptor like protein 4 [Tanacetum cinerariifolium]